MREAALKKRREKIAKAVRAGKKGLWAKIGGKEERGRSRTEQVELYTKPSRGAHQ